MLSGKGTYSKTWFEETMEWPCLPGASGDGMNFHILTRFNQDVLEAKQKVGDFFW